MKIRPHYEWVEYPAAVPGDDTWLPYYAGFRMRVLVNATLWEQQIENALYEASLGDDPDTHEAYWKGVAGRVVAWNLARNDQDGTLTAVPAPGQAEGSWLGFLELTVELSHWVREIIHRAHWLERREWLQGRTPVSVKPGGLGDSDPLPPAC